ncbi:hypothetical protein C2S52_016852 [Perilla frutescens var. hirtella]|nr:hypothetical protein C2S52_016852 [Perilla frutescens var. hirtella]
MTTSSHISDLSSKASSGHETLVGVDFDEVKIAFQEVQNSKGWMVNTGLTYHLCGNRDLFSTYKPIVPANQIKSEGPYEVCGEGKIVLMLTSGIKITLADVMYLPGFPHNVISASRLLKEARELKLHEDMMFLSDHGHVIGHGFRENGWYKLEATTVVCKLQ